MKRKTKLRLERKARCYKEIIRNHIFCDYFYSGDLEKTICKIQKHKCAINKYIYFLDFFAHFKDYRRGEETYGYKNKEDIESTLSYISDRFVVEYRLRWLVGLLDYFPKYQK